MSKFKLQWRVFSFLLLFCTLLIVILWLFQTVFLTDMYKYTRTREIQEAIKLVEQNINNDNLQDVLNDLEKNKEIIVMPSHEFSPPNKPNQNSPGRLQPVAITEAREFILNDGRTISLTFYALITPVTATVTTLQAQLYLITAIMLFLAVILAIIIAKRISKPIEEINKGAKVLATGNYEVTFAGQGFLEIKELSDTLNTAAIELGKVERLRKELIANISHDLRTPLTLIYSYAEMMYDFPDEISRKQTQIIMDETKRLSSLVNDVLDISRLETGVIPVNMQRFNITKSLKETIFRVNELVKREGYTINFKYEKELDVIADEVKIIQAFYNLLINAINYSLDEKNIDIYQKKCNKMLKIEVVDKGEGIAKEDLLYIWDRYYKLDKKHKRPLAGTGLGLSIVKTVVDLHLGKYGVESVEGVGSTFWFEIPCIE